MVNVVLMTQLLWAISIRAAGLMVSDVDQLSGKAQACAVRLL
jgi:hypothetical protein